MLSSDFGAARYTTSPVSFQYTAADASAACNEEAELRSLRTAILTVSPIDGWTSLVAGSASTRQAAGKVRKTGGCAARKRRRICHGDRRWTGGTEPGYSDALEAAAPSH